VKLLTVIFHSEEAVRPALLFSFGLNGRLSKELSRMLVHEDSMLPDTRVVDGWLISYKQGPQNPRLLDGSILQFPMKQLA
jgi:hypothetical protein